VQIPNATVYKSTITNFSGNDSRRAEFTVGIGHDSPSAKAQSLIMDVLRNHPAVMADPEPLVLVDELGPASVNLKASYWFDSATYAPNKINSALLRISKDAFLRTRAEMWPHPRMCDSGRVQGLGQVSIANLGRNLRAVRKLHTPTVGPTRWQKAPEIELNRTPSTDGDARDGSNFVAEHSLDCFSLQTATDLVRGALS
jgi:hypothetical protein